MNADNIWVLPDELYNRIVSFYLLFFCNSAFHWLFILHAYMPPKAENLLAHCFLEPICEGECHDHYGNADRCCRNGKTNNEP